MTIAATYNVVWKSAYHDSVTLMRLTRDLESVPGVTRAAAMMATPPNRALLEQAGLLTTDGARASANDLVIAVIADDPAAAEAAAAAARAALTAPAAPVTGSTRRGGVIAAAAPAPRTLDSALGVVPETTLAFVSVPGLYAGAEALKALRRGLHVMLFSDNVPLETEIELKRFAAARDLFLMGPDCGTAIIDGVPLGFANAVPRGRIGIAAASGTGLQEVACHVVAGGEGISHAIGVGGRDLSDAVGGLMMERALAALGADPGTEVVCVVGKPPGAKVAERLAAWTAALGKPCVLSFVGGAAGMGGGAGGTRTTAGDARSAVGTGRGSVHVADSLEDAARGAVALARKTTPTRIEFDLPADDVERLVETAVRGMAPGQRYVRGIYAGGTLAGEARALLAAGLDGVAPGLTGGGDGHRVVDLGEDVFTVGRPHPMIDGTVRREWIAREAADPATAVLLLDVVLGYGAHPDPVGEVLPALGAARDHARIAGRALAMVASVCGTDADSQGKAGQIQRLQAAGVIVMPSNAQAARLAARIAGRLAHRA